MKIRAIRDSRLGFDPESTPGETVIAIKQMEGLFVPANNNIDNNPDVFIAVVCIGSFYV